MRLPRGVVPEVPGPGQESVWDYPRPPVVVTGTEHVVIELGGVIIAETRAPLRLLETSHPPTYYLPRGAWREDALRPAEGSSVCEWKGVAAYLTVVSGDLIETAAAWTYPSPLPAFEVLRDHVAVYPGRMTRCTVDGEVAHAQQGGFYGGWITSRVVGPFKGGPGSWGW